MADDDNINWANLSGLLSTGQQSSQQSSDAQATGFDSKTQSSIDTLQPDFADRTRQWVQGMRDQGYDPVLHFGYRSPDEQQALYQKYLAGGNKAVAPPMSYHTYGRAFDWANRNAKTGELEWNNDAAYSFGQKLAKKYGLTGISGDNDHIQDANYKTWKDLPRGDYGNPGRRQVAQAATNPAVVPPAAALSSTTGGVTFSDLSSLLQR